MNPRIGTPVWRYWNDPHGDEPVISAAIVLSVYDGNLVDIVYWCWDRGANNYLEGFEHLLPYGGPTADFPDRWWNWPVADYVPSDPSLWTNKPLGTRP